MKLRHVALVVPSPPDEARHHVAAALLEEGWEGRWLDPWSALAHQGSEGGNVIAGPFAAYTEIRWGITVSPAGETVVHLEQTRNTWAGKGGVLDGKRAGKRLDALVAGLRRRWPTAAGTEPAPTR